MFDELITELELEMQSGDPKIANNARRLRLIIDKIDKPLTIKPVDTIKTVDVLNIDSPKILS